MRQGLAWFLGVVVATAPAASLAQSPADDRAAQEGERSAPGEAVDDRAPAPNGQEAKAPAKAKADAGADQEAADRRSAAEAIRARAKQVRELMDGTLSPAVDAIGLFDTDLSDHDALAVETARLQAVLDGTGRGTGPAVQVSAPAEEASPADEAAAGDGEASGPGKNAKPAKHTKKTKAGQADKPNEPNEPNEPEDAPTEQAAQPPADAGVAEPAPPAPDPGLMAARLDLDRARLSFYRLPPEQRTALMEAHAERRAHDAESRLAAGLSDMERKAASVERERQQALAAAQRARTEADRLLAEESVRLLGVARAQTEYEAELMRQRQALESRAERTLVFRRQVRELVEGDDANAARADRLYVELRTWLRGLRDQLADALAARGDAGARVPEPGQDELAGISVEIDREAIDKRRQALLDNAEQLRASERKLQRATFEQLAEQVRVLNADRLALLAHLSPARRAAITSFGVDGWDQAAAELRQVTLVLYGHLVQLIDWVQDLRNPTAQRGRSAVTVTWVLLKLIFVWVLFMAWRRRAGPFLADWRAQLKEAHARSRSVGPDRAGAMVDFLVRIRTPLEWLLFVLLIQWLLPANAARLLEVAIVVTVLKWTLGGALAVAALDALASTELGVQVRRTYPPPDRAKTGDLRLRSLRLIGRTVVVFGLILSISELLVGKGTIYGWVFSVCWFAAIPIVLVLVRWWRGAIFERVSAVRKKGRFETWVVANQTGWQSFPAALLAGVYLLVTGTVRFIRSWASSFDVTRRALSYLFRRGLDKLAEERAAQTFGPLPAQVFSQLGPEVASNELVGGEAEDEVDAVIRRIQRRGGGVYAVVGERGAGKTTVLRRVRERLEATVLVDCPPAGLEQLRLALASEIGRPDADLETSAGVVDGLGRDPALLIDNAHRLIQPVMGGLAAFDALIDVARRHTTNCTWFLAVDDVVWRFFERARGARPLFDEVIRLSGWRETEISGLLNARNEQVGITPNFDNLLGEVPADADEVDMLELREQTRRSFHRLLWDYSNGNPGVALHMWRRSLGVSSDGKICVTVFQAPDTADLERLPDKAVFVLRAVIQLEPADPGDVARATMLQPQEVDDALRYGLARGYFERRAERYHVTWAWFRPITRFLQRRHLLPASL